MVLRSIAGRNCSSTLAGVATVVGVVAVVYGPLRPDFYTLTLLLLLVGIAVVLSVLYTQAPWRGAVIAFSFGVAAAFVTLVVALDELAQRWSPADDGERVIALVEITSLLERGYAGVEFEAEVLIESPASRERRLRAKVMWREPPSAGPRAGERWRLMLQMHAPRANRNPGGFDEQREFFRDRLHARATVRAFRGNTRLDPAPAGLLRIRDAIVRHIRHAVLDRDAAALFSGLAVGATGEVSREQWRVFSDTGTTHLVAISGMHVTLFCWVVAALARRGWRRSPWLAMHVDREPFAAMLGVPAAVCYAALAGFGIPAQRTVVMLAVWWALKLAGRVHSGFDVLGVAAIAVLMVDPFAPLASGFWLSFVAMATLIATEATSSSGLRAWIVQTLRTQWRVSLALLPVTIWWFSSVSLAGLLVNLVAIPVFSFVLVPVALLGALFSMVAQPLARPLWWVGERAHELMWPMLVAVAAHPLAAIDVHPASWFPSLHYERPASGEFIATLLEAGDGTALIVRTRHHAILYDTGETYTSEGRAAERLVQPALQAYGVSKISVLVLSASHAYRAAGAGRLMTALPIDRVIAGGSWPGAHRPVESCDREQRWRVDGVEFVTFGVPGGSCLLRVGFDGGPALLVADRLDAAEAARLTQALSSGSQRLRATVVVAPRRGATSALTSEFVAAVDPHWVLLPGARIDPRRRAAVALRWRVEPSRVLATADQGAVQVHLRGGLPPRWPKNAALQGHPLWRYHPGSDSSRGTDAMQDRPRP